jgi:signal peptidase II
VTVDTPRAGRTRTRLVLSVAAAVVVVDQLTKAWAVAALADGPVHLFWTLDLRLTHNTGVAFSNGQGLGWLFGIVAVLVVVVLLRHSRRLPGVGAAVALGAVMGGALGNLVDRMVRGDAWLRGGVVDFIDLNWWPIFNVADAAITLGVIGLLVTLSAGDR